MPPYAEPLDKRVEDLETASARTFARVIERLNELEAQFLDLEERLTELEERTGRIITAPIGDPAEVAR